MSRIINESTSVVQIDSSGLQGGAYATVYVSTTTIPGQLVTVNDATGFLSSPQTILLSTTGGASFSDGSFSTLLTQGFAYITLVSQDTNTWEKVNTTPFPVPTSSIYYKAVDARTFTSPTLITGLLSSGTTSAKYVETGQNSGNVTLASTFYVNTLSSFLASSPQDPALTLQGSAHIYGSTITTGAGSFRSSLNVGGDVFNTGNISSKLGTIYIGGSVTTSGSIRGQRGNIIQASTLNISTTAGFVRAVSVGTTVVSHTFVNAQQITALQTTGRSMNVMSSIIFSPTQSLQNMPGYLNIVNTSATIPSTVSTNWLTASNSIQTSNLSIQSFTDSPTLTLLALGSTQITNAGGSASMSSISGNTLALNSLQSLQTRGQGQFTGNNIIMNNATPSGFFSISYTGGSIQVPNYWMISSIGNNGTFNAPLSIVSTNNLIGTNIRASTFIAVNDTTLNCDVQDVTIQNSLIFTGGTAASLKNVLINNTGGSIIGGEVDTVETVFCSSMKANIITSPHAISFTGSNTFALPVTYISSLTAGYITTSSLTVSRINTGNEERYSTVNSSTPWIQISSYQMNTPFNTTTGLGTYFDEVSFTGTKSQTAYYSLIDPTAQTKINLPTPYVNTVAKVTGTMISQPAADSKQNVYAGVNNRGWRLQRLTSAGPTTLAGNYQYFYGDGGFPLNAAVGPKLGVSMASPGALLITDISNVRIRYVTTDPIITTIAGTGATGYTGDGGLALNATFSTPTTTATDQTGRIFLSDTGNNVIRVIDGSTIATYGGTGQPGSNGDNGPATAARLNSPFGLTVTGENNLFFTDLSNCVIRRITPVGVIERLAGIYAPGFGGDGGQANSSIMSYPRGITSDFANNIYFCDTGNARVRRIDAVTQVITTVAGNGVHAFGGDGGLAVNANLSSPTGVATDATGNLYIADTNNQVIRFVNMTTNRITTVAGRPRIAGYGGDQSFATFATLNYPSHIVFDPTSQYYYIADDRNSRIRYVNSITNIIFTAAGNGSPLTAGDGGPAINAVFGSITSVATDASDNIFLTDGIGNAIRRIDAVTSTITTVAGTSRAGFNGDGPALTTNLSSPQTMVFDASANIYFTDTNNQRVRFLNVQTNRISTLAGTGVAGYNGDSISSIQAQLNSPQALTRDASGALYVGDTQNFRVRRLDPNGFITTYAGNGIYEAPISGNPLITPIGRVTSLTAAQGQIYMADSTTSALWTLSTTMVPVSAISTPAYLGDAAPLSNAYFNNPGLSSDSSGNLLISDTGNSRVRRTYTFGYPLNPIYINMKFNYTNYFTSTGSSYITINGNLLSTFSASSQQNESYSITDANILDYPLQTSNPVLGDQTPFIEITQNAFNYTKLDGNVWLEGYPGQALQQNTLNSNAGIIMNSGTLVFPYQNNGITLQNKYNDASLRTVNYTGSLISLSDPALKEKIQPADLERCYTNLAALPLRRYNYSAPYVSTFQVRDKRRLGFLTSEVAPTFPNSITPVAQTWMPSTINTLDTGQIKFTHFGVTQRLMTMVSTLEEAVSAAQRTVAELAQRNNTL
jgi:sugar lactone lactonase YvrE